METMASEEMNKEQETNNNNKCCADCKTTKTPLWRVGPSGPKSLCNACGIRYRKKRPSVGPPGSDRKRERPSQSRSATAGSDTGKAAGLSESVRMSLVLLGNDLMLQKKQRFHRKRKLREEELAAVSLMALSCSSSVFA